MMGKIFLETIKFILDNKDTISNVASAAYYVVDTVGKVCNTTFDIDTKARQLKNKQPITDDAINKILNANDTPKTGSVFFTFNCQSFLDNIVSNKTVAFNFCNTSEYKLRLAPLH